MSIPTLKRNQQGTLAVAIDIIVWPDSYTGVDWSLKSNESILHKIMITIVVKVSKMCQLIKIINWLFLGDWDWKDTLLGDGICKWWGGVWLPCPKWQNERERSQSKIQTSIKLKNFEITESNKIYWIHITNLRLSQLFNIAIERTSFIVIWRQKIYYLMVRWTSRLQILDSAMNLWLVVNWTHFVGAHLMQHLNYFKVKIWLVHHEPQNH